jgi:isopentenyl-diphosphate delta-isomerase
MSVPQTSSAVVIVVDEHDRQIGVCDKLLAHRPPGRRHRAFSVFLFTAQGRLLLQQRALTKYHFAGKWSNSCDGHPEPAHDVVPSATRRVREELGVAARLTHAGTFTYRAVDDISGCVEDEVDHVLIGELIGEPRLNAEEVAAIDYCRLEELPARVTASPGDFVPWLSPGLALLHAAGIGGAG